MISINENNTTPTPSLWEAEEETTRPDTASKPPDSGSSKAGTVEEVEETSGL